MSNKLASILTLLLALGLLAPATFADDEAPAPAKPKEEEAPAKPAGPVIKIVEAGAEPHVQLRFKPTPGSKLTTSAKLVVGFMMSGMGGTMDIDVICHMTVDKGSKDGQFKVSGKLAKCEMADDPNNPMTGQLKPMIDGLTGVTFTGEYSSLGKWLDNPAGNMENVPPQSAQFANMIGVIFGGIMVEVPEGAIGTGGSWTEDSDITERGTKMKSHSLYKVEKVEGDRVTLSYTTEREGANGKLNMMGMEVNVIKATGSGEGTMNLDLALGLANTATLKMKGVQETDAMGNIESTVEGKQTTKAGHATTGDGAADPAATDPLAKMRALGMPGKMHEHLKAFVGEWTTDATFWMGPQVTKEPGTASHKLVNGGRYLEIHYAASFGGKPFEGRGYIGYNNAKQKYEMLWIDDVGSGMDMKTGTASEDGKTITLNGTFEMEGASMPVRMEFKVLGPDSFKLTNWTKVGEEELKDMEIIYTRKK